MSKSKERRQEITPRAKTKDALRKERDLFSAVIDTAAVLVVVLDPQGQIVRFNRACEQVTGYGFDEVKGRPFWDVFLIPEEAEAVKGVFGKLRAGQFPNEHENHWITKDGRRRLIAWSNTALLDDHGSVEYIVGTGIDLTERKRGEEALRDSEEKFRALLEYASVAIIIVDGHGLIQLVNAKAEEVFGYARREMLGHPVEVLLPKRFRHAHVGLRGGFLANPRPRPMNAPLDLWAVRKDGTEFPVEVGLSPVQTRDGVLVMSYLTDITERRRAEVALKESEKKYRRLIENLQEGVWAVDAEGKTTFVNTRMAEILGYTVDEMLGSPMSAFMDESAIVLARQNLERRRRGIREQHDFELIRKDGTRICTSVAASPITDDDGSFIGALACVADITERRRAEVELQAALRRAQEVDQLKSQLLSIVSHELRTPLTSIRGQTTTLLDYADQVTPEDRLEALQIVDDEAERLDELISHLLDMSRLEAGTLSVELGATDVRPILIESISRMAAHAPSHKLVVNLPSTLPPVQADPRRVVQVVSNLLDNAIKFSPPSAIVSVDAEVDADAVRVRVRDEGPGIAPEHLPHIFDRFYRVEGPGVRTSGVGLGLAICKGLVEAMGGHIAVTSQAGHGTIFSFSLLRAHGM